MGNCEGGGKTIGLITGCFDVFHIGHVKTLQFAKKRCDVLIVGIDNDKSVRINKGKGRPIFKARERAIVLASTSMADFIFIVPEIFKSGSLKSEMVHDKITQLLQPNCIISHPPTDSQWKNRKNRAEKFNTKWMPHKEKTLTTSTQIIEKLKQL